MNEIDYDSKQTQRLDEINNSVFEFLKVFLNDENLPWNIDLIDSVINMSGKFLTKRGYKIYYPSIMESGDGEQYISDHYFEDIKQI